jgi:hypothetical protein
MVPKTNRHYRLASFQLGEVLGPHPTTYFHFAIREQNQEREKKKKKKITAQSIPMWSPTIVLTLPSTI